MFDTWFAAKALSAYLVRIQDISAGGVAIQHHRALPKGKVGRTWFFGHSMGAALAYYTVFSIAPLLIIVIGVAGLVFGRGGDMDRLSPKIFLLTPPGLAKPSV